MTAFPANLRENWFAPAEYEWRLAAVRRVMTQRGLDALVIFSAANVYYLTGHHSIDSWEFRAVVVTPDGEPVLMLYEFERGRFLASSWLSVAVFFGPADDPAARLVAILHERGLGGGRIGIERTAANLDLATYLKLKKSLPKAALVDVDRAVDRLRAVKSAEELNYVRRAAELTRIGMKAAREAIREGVRDCDLTAVACDAMFRAGSHQLVMQPTVAIGSRSGISHSQHDGVVAKRGDSIFVELSGNYRHYSAPLMHTEVVGGIDSPRQELLDVARRVAETIVESARPGVPARDVAAKARAAMRSIEERIQFHYVFGYSVGISFPPHWLEESHFHLRETNREPIEAGMVFHLPLTMRILGRHGVGLSHTILITDSGAEILTGSDVENDSIP